MEPWQINHITENLSPLISDTVVDLHLLTELTSRCVLLGSEVDLLKCAVSESEKAHMLYTILPTRKCGYYALISALNATRQTNALKTLLTYPIENIRCIRVEMSNEEHLLESLLSENQLKALQAWLLANFLTEDFMEQQRGLIMNNPVISLIRNAIPHPPSIYIPRILYRKMAVDSAFFSQICPDVCVFKTIERTELRKFVKAFAIETSTSVLLKKKVDIRFIILRSETHWTKLCKLTESPIHLMNYDKHTETFVLQATSGGSGILRKHLKRRENCDEEQISENALLELMLEPNCQGFCICEKADMGKSWLLASLARQIQSNKQGRIVAFVQMENFLLPEEQLKKSILNWKLTLFSQISTSAFASQILLELAESQNLNFDLFLDGLDQVPETHAEFATSLISKIHEYMPKTRIYVALRPYMQTKLEKIFGDIAYNILPFDEITQVNLLTSHWMERDLSSRKEKLDEFARFYLSNFRMSLKENEENLAGIPAYCNVIADVYEDQASVYADSECLDIRNNCANSLTQIYKRYVASRLGETICNFTCMYKHHYVRAKCTVKCQVKSFHVWLGISRILPDVANLISQYVTEFFDLGMQNILKPGILALSDDTQCTSSRFVFAHESFAEYLVAEYIASLFFTKKVDVVARRFVQTIFDEIFTFDDAGTFPNLTLRKHRLAHMVNSLGLFGNKVSVFLGKAVIPSSSFEFLGTLVGCIRFDYEALLELYFKAASNSDKWICTYHKKFLKENANVSIQILETAAKFCKLETVQKLNEFFTLYLDHDLVYICSSMPTYTNVVKVAIQKADYELFHFLLDDDFIENHGFLYSCMENTYYDDCDLIDKKLDIAQFLLSKCTSLVNKSWKGYSSPLFSASIHIEAIQFLVRNGATIKVLDAEQKTPLHHAVMYMSCDNFARLWNFLSSKIDEPKWFLNITSWQKFFQKFEYTSRKCDIKTILLALCLLNPSNIFTLEEILNETNDELLKRLLKPKFYQKLWVGFIALYRMAVVQGNTEIIDILSVYDNSLLDLKYDDEQTALHMACKTSLETFKCLVKAGADVFVLDGNGETILHTLVRNGDNDLCYSILEFLGGLRNKTNSEHNETINCNVKPCCPTNFSELFNWKERESLKTPLHYAIENLEIKKETIALLIFGGKASKQEGFPAVIVDLNSLDANGRAVLHYAIENKRCIGITKYLVLMGANFCVSNEFGCNIVHVCAQYELPKHLEYFMELGCDVNELDSQGNNALQCAFCYFYEGQSVDKLCQTIQILVEAGASKIHKNFNGMTAEEIASKRQFPFDVLKLL